MEPVLVIFGMMFAFLAFLVLAVLLLRRTRSGRPYNADLFGRLMGSAFLAVGGYRIGSFEGGTEGWDLALGWLFLVSGSIQVFAPDFRAWRLRRKGIAGAHS